MNEEERKKLVKKRTKIFTISATIVFTAFIVHLYLAYGSTGFIDKIFEGDMVTIVSSILTTWLLVGWFILFRVFRNIP